MAKEASVKAGEDFAALTEDTEVRRKDNFVVGLNFFFFING
jgi:hypothetical protein